MKIKEILLKKTHISLSKLAPISAGNTKDYDVLCDYPDEILKEISNYYKILWSTPNLTFGVTAAIFDTKINEVFRIDLSKELYLISERTYPKRIKSTFTASDLKNDENLTKFRELRKKLKQQLKSGKNKDIDQTILNEVEQKEIKVEKISFYEKIRKRGYKIFSRPKKIVFLGPDGAGKSTAIDMFMNENAGAFSKIKYIHLKFSIARDLKSKNSVQVSKPHSNPPYGYLKSIIKYFYLISQYFLGVLYLNIRHSKKDLILFDRYYYDVIVDPKRFRLKEIKALGHLMKYLIPSPDLVIIIGAKAETIYKRKQDLTLNEIIRQLSVYSEICGPNIIRIMNEDKSISDLSKEIKNKVLSNL